MPTLVVITAPEQAAALVRWGMRFALARGEKLAVLAVLQGRQTGTIERLPFSLPPETEEDDPLVRAIRAGIAAAHAAEPAAEQGHNAPAMAPVIRRLRHPRPVPTVLDLVKELAIGLLVVGTRAPPTDHHEHPEDLGRELMRQAPCDLLLLRGLGDPQNDRGRILVAAAGGPHATVALRLVAKLVAVHRASCTALYVTPDAGPEAAAVGRYHLDRALARAGLESDAAVERRVVVGGDVRAAIAGESAHGYDLVVVGASEHSAASRLLFGTIAEHLLASTQPVSMAVVRRADPLHERLWKRASRWAHARVPQLAREERVALTDRLLTNSRVGFDFLALMVLSTAIAGLGLIQDSTAVVVGAMLVAPLMTPIVGAGLALVQGNALLVRECARSITIGFCTALAVGLVLGLLTPISQLTSELSARGGPNILDLGVAFVSGIAGAYAMARPNLSAALPGVAIAAALVPPIATVGIAVAIGEVAIARGATLLFGTNVVAIILGAALALYAVGLRPARGRPWPLWGRRVVGGLLGTLAVLAVPLSMVAAASWKEATAPARADLRAAVDAAAASHEAQVVRVEWRPREDGRRLEIVLQAALPPPPDVAASLAAALAQHLEAGDSLQVETRLVSAQPALE